MSPFRVNNINELSLLIKNVCELNKINYEIKDNHYELLPEVKALYANELHKPGELTGNS